MKLKSLILGSVAAAGLSTAGFAADLGVLTSLDVCDELGLSGLTISSDENCLQISGGVEYSFTWGDYDGSWYVTNTVAGGDRNIDDNNSVVGPTGEEFHHDWESSVSAWLEFVGTASSDFGAAKAVIRLEASEEYSVENEGWEYQDLDTDDDGVDDAFDVPVFVDTDGSVSAFEIDEAYVQIGDTTVIMAGQKSSIANMGDDTPFNWLGLWNGVNWDGDDSEFTVETGGHVIQVVSDLGNGINAGVALENLDGDVSDAGTVVGLLEYRGDGITAHVTGAAGGVLDGDIEAYAVHAGVTATFDNFRVRGAFAGSNDVVSDEYYWSALASAEATLDLFKLAVSADVASFNGDRTDYGIGGSVGMEVTEGVEINLGGRYHHPDETSGEFAGYQIAAQLVAAVTETIEFTGEVGVYGTDSLANPDQVQTDFYAGVGLGWNPGGGFESEITAQAQQNGAYAVSFEASKSFE
jgi:hypothetical protein